MNAEAKIIITIDGPAGSGKSTLARGLAKALNGSYISTGATYRALAVAGIKHGINPDSSEEAVELLNKLSFRFVSTPDHNLCGHVFINSEEITEQLEGVGIGSVASRISQHAEVRSRMVALQRSIVASAIADSAKQGVASIVIVEGRDTGTVVFPTANFKIYLTADLEERARRQAQKEAENSQKLERVILEIKERDMRDTTREVSPLVPAPDAIILDNTSLKPSETLNRALEIIRERRILC